VVILELDEGSGLEENDVFGVVLDDFEEIVEDEDEDDDGMGDVRARLSANQCIFVLFFCALINKATTAVYFSSYNSHMFQYLRLS
jgi:hypothetical protein